MAMGTQYVCVFFGEAEGVGDPRFPCNDCGSIFPYWSTAQMGAVVFVGDVEEFEDPDPSGILRPYWSTPQTGTEECLA
jgi:hypothetical protein